MSTVTVLRLNVRDGCDGELVATFKERRVLEAAREECGLVSARLLRPSTPGDPFVVIGEWKSAADYGCWLDSPVRAKLAEALEPLLDSEPGGGDLYSPVDEL